MSADDSPSNNATQGDSESLSHGDPSIYLSQLGKALGHEIRIEIIAILGEVEEASPNELAEQIGAALATVSYHVRYLKGMGVVELRRWEPRRGAIKHFYGLSDAMRAALPFVHAAGAMSLAQIDPDDQQ